jgi:hypothetical protein
MAFFFFKVYRKITLIVINPHAKQLFKACHQPLQVGGRVISMLQEKQGAIYILQTNNPCRIHRGH